MSKAPSRPLLRYPGSKFRLADWIISHFPEHKVYVEPFGGTAAVLLAKKPSKVEVYNDLDAEIVNVFKVMRDPELAEELKKIIYLTPYARDEHVTLFETTGDPVEDARRFIVRSTMNIAKGPYRKSGFDTRINDDFYISRLNFHLDYPEVIDVFVKRLRGVVIENRHYSRIINQFDQPEALFYCDPEYIETNAIYNPDFSIDDHVKLCDLLLEAQGMAVVSGYESDLYRQKFETSGWTKKQAKAYADGGHRRTECLWLNPAVQELQRQKDFFTNSTII
jgi:DNA adenine methylase